MIGNRTMHPEQLSAQAAAQRTIDLDYWREPQGVVIPDDSLRFLLIPDDVEAAAVFDIARQIHDYQCEFAGTLDQITKALMVTMGGLLPGVLLYDHIVEGRRPSFAEIEFGTVGVSLYEGPGKRLAKPIVMQDVSVPVAGETTLIVDDLGDYGGTMHFLVEYIEAKGARKVLTAELYSKPAARERCPATFWFGQVPQDTWIITPRERVETLIKRVPAWKEQGASLDECRRRLVHLIGYPPYLVDYYLPTAYSQDEARCDNHSD